MDGDCLDGWMEVWLYGCMAVVYESTCGSCWRSWCRLFFVSLRGLTALGDWKRQETGGRGEITPDNGLDWLCTVLHGPGTRYLGTIDVPVVGYLQ